MIFSSLGEICHASSLLKRNNLKVESHPFDWIFSSPSMIKHCIEDDFKTFLNKDYYLDYTNDSTLSEKVCYHTFYGDMIYNYEDKKMGGRNHMFNHHNPMSNSSDYEYFQRCIYRFKEMLRKEDKKLFISFYGQKGLSHNNMINIFTDFTDFIGNHTNNYEILVIHNQYSGYRKHNIVRRNNLYFLDLKLKSNTNGTAFDDESDNMYLDRILHEVINDI